MELHHNIHLFSSGIEEIMFECIKVVLIKLGLDLLKQMANTIDGAFCMTGMHQGAVVRLRVLVTHFVGLHCIVHREALAVNVTCLGL